MSSLVPLQIFARAAVSLMNRGDHPRTLAAPGCITLILIVWFSILPGQAQDDLDATAAKEFVNTTLKMALEVVNNDQLTSNEKFLKINGVVTASIDFGVGALYISDRLTPKLNERQRQELEHYITQWQISEVDDEFCHFHGAALIESSTTARPLESPPMPMRDVFLATTIIQVKSRSLWHGENKLWETEWWVEKNDAGPNKGETGFLIVNAVFPQQNEGGRLSRLDLLLDQVKSSCRNNGMRGLVAELQRLISGRYRLRSCG